MIIRNYQPSDLDEIITLFYETVHTINAKDYTQEQLNAWAPQQLDRENWHQSLSRNYSLVAIQNSQILGFGDIDQTAHLNRLYIHKKHQGQKLASQICDQLENHVLTGKITVHASITAKPFFEKRAYKTRHQQEVKRNHILLTNYVMEKTR